MASRCVVLVSTFLFACAASGAKPAPAGTRPSLEPQPIPAECVAPVARARTVGRQLHHAVSVASKARHDLDRLKWSPPPNSMGWVVTESPTGPVVHFLAEDAGRVVELALVSFPQGHGAEGTPTVFEVPGDADARLAGAARARVTAASAQVHPCGDQRALVLLPTPAESGWYVYSLPAVKGRGFTASGQYRLLVSEDGKKVVSTEPLSKTCIEQADDPGAVAAVMSNLVWPCPTEAHVLLSLHTGKEVYVSNRTGFWRVAGEAIDFLETPK